MLQFQPDVFHNGHAGVFPNLLIQKCIVPLLKKGAIIMNVFELDKLKDFIFGNFILEFKAAYSPGFYSVRRIYTIFKKKRDFSEEERELIYECARIADARFSVLTGKEEQKAVFDIVTKYYKREIEPKVSEAQKKRIMEIGSSFETKYKKELEEAMSLFL